LKTTPPTNTKTTPGHTATFIYSLRTVNIQTFLKSSPQKLYMEQLREFICA